MKVSRRLHAKVLVIALTTVAPLFTLAQVESDHGVGPPPAQPPVLDLGNVPEPASPTSGSSEVAAPSSPASGPSARAPRNSRTNKVTSPVSQSADARVDDDRIERVQFGRAPIHVALQVARERRVTFPNPIALHVPSGSDALLHVQIIERTAYLRAEAPLHALRVIAEDLVTGRMVPVDIDAEAPASTSSRDTSRTAANTSRTAEIEVFYRPHAGVSATGDAAESDDDPPPLDKVALTRYAAQMTYAPRRLLPRAAEVHQVPVSAAPVSGLLRGTRLAAVPLGQWRSGPLYVTAVRVTNLEHTAVDLDLDELRGSWLAATAQHHRLLASGTEWDTSTLYLVCDRPFEACR